MGFTAATPTTVEESMELLMHVEPEDLMRFGFIPEFIGRLPVVTALHPLTDEAMLDILTGPKNAIVKQYQKLLLLEGVELSFEQGALEAIVAKAQKRRTGARALRGVMEEVMNPIMYMIPDVAGIRKCVVTTEVVTNGANPVLELSDQAQAEQPRLARQRRAAER
jgi:ATP-dependent Clp protease ATP-binding subunit ClpX